MVDEVVTARVGGHVALVWLATLLLCAERVEIPLVVPAESLCCWLPSGNASEQDVNVPKTKKAFFCEPKECKKHQMHKVMQNKAGNCKASLFAQGKRTTRTLPPQCTPHTLCGRGYVPRGRRPSPPAFPRLASRCPFGRPRLYQ